MSDFTKSIWKALGYALAIAIVALVVGFFFMLFWNVGVIGVAAACGATVGKLDLVTAIGAAFFIRCIGSLLFAKQNDAPSTVVMLTEPKQGDE